MELAYLRRNWWTVCLCICIKVIDIESSHKITWFTEYRTDGNFTRSKLQMRIRSFYHHWVGWMMCFLLMTLVLVLILNPLLDFFLYIKLMCPYFILLIYTDGERDGLWMACPFRTLVVLYRMFPFIICLILMNYLMEFYFIGFINAHLPGCFCPWTFRLNIGLNTSPSDSFVSYLNSHLGYSAGEFQALQLIVLAVFGAVD